MDDIILIERVGLRGLNLISLGLVGFVAAIIVAWLIAGRLRCLFVYTYSVAGRQCKGTQNWRGKRKTVRTADIIYKY